MIELKIGKMTYEELAEWRGVQTNNVYKNFKKFSEELSEYCRFERCKKGRKYAGVEIIEIYTPVYIKKRSKDYERMKKFVPIHVDKYPDIVTGIHVAVEYQKAYKDCTLKLKTLAAYANKIIKEFYGDGKIVRYGTHGISKIIAGVSWEHIPRAMTEEELKKRHELLEEFVYKPQREMIGNLSYEEETELVGALNDCAAKGAITKEEMLKASIKKEDDKEPFDPNWAYQEFRYACCDEFGGWPIKAKKCKNEEEEQGE